MDEYKTIKVGKNNIDYIQKGTGENIVFFHGFGNPPDLSLNLINFFSKKYKITSPKLTAINYLEEQPESIEEYKNIAKIFMENLEIESRYLIGQSFGGSLVLDLLKEDSKKNKAGVAINPIIPTNYLLPSTRLSLITLYLIHKHSLGKFRFLKNSIKKPLKTKALMKIVSNYSWDKIYTTNPTLLIHSRKDELFWKSIPDLELRKNQFGNLEIEVLENLGHMWHLESPNKLFEIADSFFKNIN